MGVGVGVSRRPEAAAPPPEPHQSRRGRAVPPCRRPAAGGGTGPRRAPSSVRSPSSSRRQRARRTWKAAGSWAMPVDTYLAPGPHCSPLSALGMPRPPGADPSGPWLRHALGTRHQAAHWPWEAAAPPWGAAKGGGGRDAAAVHSQARAGLAQEEVGGEDGLNQQRRPARPNAWPTVVRHRREAGVLRVGLNSRVKPTPSPIGGATLFCTV